mmetsp:Transcript_1813/g.6676  ORF Transcript_1813/g.6676 Transcript_1813/m.6676 type:complete len:435 (+) Transcript_1813:621-1925(+)
MPQPPKLGHPGIAYVSVAQVEIPEPSEVTKDGGALVGDLARVEVQAPELGQPEQLQQAGVRAARVPQVEIHKLPAPPELGEVGTWDSAPFQVQVLELLELQEGVHGLVSDGATRQAQNSEVCKAAQLAEALVIHPAPRQVELPEGRQGPKVCKLLGGEVDAPAQLQPLQLPQAHNVLKAPGQLAAHVQGELPKLGHSPEEPELRLPDALAGLQAERPELREGFQSAQTLCSDAKAAVQRERSEARAQMELPKTLIGDLPAVRDLQDAEVQPTQRAEPVVRHTRLRGQVRVADAPSREEGDDFGVQPVRLHQNVKNHLDQLVGDEIQRGSIEPVRAPGKVRDAGVEEERDARARGLLPSRRGRLVLPLVDGQPPRLGAQRHRGDVGPRQHVLAGTVAPRRRALIPVFSRQDVRDHPPAAGRAHLASVRQSVYLLI